MNNFATNKLSKNRLFQFLIISVFTVFIGLSFQFSAIGSGSGRTGSYESGCTSCHGLNSSANTSVALTSGSTTVQTGSTTQYTITITTSSGRSKAGINIAVQNSQSGGQFAGSLNTVNSDLKKVGSELTHNGTPKSFDGGTTVTFTFSWTAPETAGTYYLKAAANAVNGNGSADNNGDDQWKLLTPVAITVNAPPSISLLDPNGSKSFCPGSNYTIQWESNDVANVKIELSNNGGSSYTIVATNSTNAASGSYVYAVPPGLTPGNQYKVKVSAVENSSIFDASDNNNSVPGGITIMNNPQNTEVCQGAQAIFQITNSGFGAKYQWRKDGQNIASANNPSIQINNVQASNIGNYDCVVTTDCGFSATSSSATLSIIETPQIIVQPLTQTICKGSDLVLFIETNSGNYDIEWFKNNVKINGQTEKQLMISNVNESHAGDYKAVVSGFCPPNTTSNIAVIKVIETPYITTNLSPTKTCLGDTVKFEIFAEGGDLEYQWRKNSQNITNATSKTYEIKGVKESDLAAYDVIISNKCGNPLTSATIGLSLYTQPSITTQPTNKDLFVGGNLTLTVATTGDVESVQWQKNGQNIANATLPTFSKSNVQLADAGKYKAIIKNKCFEISTTEVTVNVQEQPTGPILSLNTSKVDFENVNIGNSKEINLADLITNTGSSELDISSMQFTGANSSEFTIVEGGSPIKLAVGAKHSLKIKFTPTSKGLRIANLTFTSNSALNNSVEVNGNAGNATVKLSMSDIDFENVILNDAQQKSIAIENDGDFDLKNIQLSIGGPQSSQFEIIEPTSMFDLNKGETKDIVIKFTPSSLNLAQALLSISNDLLENTFVSLKGTGVASVKEDPNLLTEFMLYPNPSSESIKIELILERMGDINLKIVDINGNSVFSKSAISYSKIMNFEWNLVDNQGNRVGNGNYRLIVESGGKFTTLPIIINK